MNVAKQKLLSPSLLPALSERRNAFMSSQKYRRNARMELNGGREREVGTFLTDNSKCCSFKTSNFLNEKVDVAYNAIKLTFTAGRL